MGSDQGIRYGSLTDLDQRVRDGIHRGATDAYFAISPLSVGSPSKSPGKSPSGMDVKRRMQMMAVAA